MKSRFTYIGDSVIEVIVNGESLTWNVLQDAAAAPVAPPRAALPPEYPPVPAAAPELPPAPIPDEVGDSMTLAAAPTKKKRTVWGVIRAAWFIIFTAVGEGLTYLLNNLTTLNLPPGTATAIGAVGYGLKRGIWPDSTI